MNNPKAKTVVICATLTALTAVMGALPFVFLVPLLYACVTQNTKVSLFMGLVFGVTSFLYSLMGGSPVAAAFVEAPWIAILPRIAVGLIAHGTFALCKRLIKGRGKAARIAPIAAAAAVGSLSNTVLVVSLLLLFMRGTSFEGVTVYLYTPTMLINGAIELAATAIIVPALALGVERALGGRKSAVKQDENGVVDVNATNENKENSSAVK